MGEENSLFHEHIIVFLRIFLLVEGLKLETNYIPSNTDGVHAFVKYK